MCSTDYYRKITPHPDDYVDIWKVEAKRDYERLIALGGRPTRPMRLHFMWKITMKDGMFTYRDEDENADVIQEPDVTSEENGLAFTHWSRESIKWKEELERWERFRETQQRYNQDRLETDLELENTDAELVDVLSKLDDWQLFEFIQQKKVHEAETIYTQCQRGMVRFQEIEIGTRTAASAPDVFEPIQGWLRYMQDGQKKLEASQDELLWVKNQWKEVLEEASHSIGASQKLQEQLEDKFEKQTNAIYRQLREKGARPSHAVYPPDRNAEFSQRIQHWISESSTFTAELWNWRIFLKWRRHRKNVDDPKPDSQKGPSQVYSCTELFEHLVEYRQCELDKAVSWVNCWRPQVRGYAEAEAGEEASLQEKRARPLANEDDEKLRDARAYAYAEQPHGRTKAEQAQVFVRRAEEKVSDAAKRLEESKQELQTVLAESGRLTTGDILVEDSKAQLQPRSPKSSSPQRLRKSRRLLKQDDPTREKQRRSKKEHLRKVGAKMDNTKTEQQTLQTSSMNPDLVGEDDDIEMTEAPSPALAHGVVKFEGAESRDTVMTDIEDPPNYTFSSPSICHPGPTTSAKSRHSNSVSAQGSTSRKTRSATKRDQASSDVVLGDTNEKPPAKKRKVQAFTQQQAKVLVNAASTNCPSAITNPPRRSERLKQKAAAKLVR